VGNEGWLLKVAAGVSGAEPQAKRPLHAVLGNRSFVNT